MSLLQILMIDGIWHKKVPTVITIGVWSEQGWTWEPAPEFIIFPTVACFDESGAFDGVEMMHALEPCGPYTP
jgi:hypothetical protein